MIAASLELVGCFSRLQEYYGISGLGHCKFHNQIQWLTFYQQLRW